MVLVETTVFTRQVVELLSDDSYRLLQAALAMHPEAGQLIEGGGGLRKIRWRLEGHGKSGGVRVIYYWAVAQERLLLLLVYAKHERDDLTAKQLAVLRKIVKEAYP